MNNQLVKFGLLVAVVAIIAYIGLKPIVYNEEKYKVVIVNTSEHDIASVILTGAGENSGIIGPIRVGMLNDYIFSPMQSGELKYSILQNERELTGVVNGALKKGDVGEIYIVVSEMYKVSVQNEFEIDN